MKWTTTFLRSKVARRIFVLFVSCALLPITILAAVSFYQVSQQLHAESRRQLMEMSESQGMLIDERLQSLDGDLQLISWQSKKDQLPDLGDPLKEHFSALAIFNLCRCHPSMAPGSSPGGSRAPSPSTTTASWSPTASGSS